MKYTIKKYCPIITRKQDKNQNQVQMKSYPNNYIQQQLKNSKEEQSMQGLNIIFGQQIQQKLDYV